MHVDSQKFDANIREPCSYYDSGFVQKWPQKQSQNICFRAWGLSKDTAFASEASHHRTQAMHALKKVFALLS